MISYPPDTATLGEGKYFESEEIKHDDAPAETISTSLSVQPKTVV